MQDSLFYNIIILLAYFKFPLLLNLIFAFKPLKKVFFSILKFPVLQKSLVVFCLFVLNSPLCPLFLDLNTKRITPFR